MINPKHIFAPLALLCSISLSAQTVGYDVEFFSTFDNREFSAVETLKERSASDFVVGLTPTLYFNLAEGNTLNFGADFTQPIGRGASDLNVAGLIYYGYDNSRWSVSMGLFERSRMMIDSYSTAFFTTDYLLDDRVVGGVMGRLMSDESFVEFVCDWEGQPTETQREKFRLLSAARRYWSALYIGYNLSITHFAGMKQEEFSNVVDNVLLNPRVGVLLGAGEVNMDFSVGYLQSLQRDRSYGNVWKAPSMVEIAAKIEYRGFSLDEAIFIGDNLMPLYGGHTLDDGRVMEYGELLYTGDPTFATEGGFYYRAAFRYDKTLCNNMIDLGIAFVTHATSEGLATEQLLELSVNFGGKLYGRNGK